MLHAPTGSEVIQTWNPHSFLGLHTDGDRKVIRLYRPNATQVYFELFGCIVEAKKVTDDGLFEYEARFDTQPQDYRVYHQNGLLAHDPYSFLPTWGEIDSHLFGRGVHYQIYEKMGARLTEHQGVSGVKFTVWAPNASRVAIVGDFNFWDGRVNLMRSMGSSGIWELFVPGLKEGERYKFEIKGESGSLLLKADPYALASETRPLTASVVANVDDYVWNDKNWLEKRKDKGFESKPMNVYEVHLGSWKRPHGHPLNYRTLAHELSAYCQEMGYTHVELMPVTEHPLDESWGYQVSGFYAVTSRYGTPQDFQYFVDILHQNGIGVFLDWVPAHFPTDAFSLAAFDGSALYEHADPRKGFHPHWQTLIFNYGRHEVSNFLIGSALFFAKKMHVDGFRCDAVASMLYLDYGREAGMWIPNPYGGNENLDAIEFLKHLNSVMHKEVPGIMMIAEESTAFSGVTRPVDHEGLGFDFKWNMGWMNDTLRYFHKDPLYRRYHHNDLTFGLLYAFSEKFCLVLSHDEVVHGKGSLLSKMPGDDWQKFANLRLLLSYMMTQPGKKMLFMGGELGQWSEWWSQEEIHWYLLQYPSHQGIQQMVKEINHLYLASPALWERDTDFSGFEWIDFGNADHSVIAYKRKGGSGRELVCVHHFTPSFEPHYFLPLHGVKGAKEVFNSDEERFWGSGKKNENIQVRVGEGIAFQLAPLATQIFEVYT